MSSGARGLPAEPRPTRSAAAELVRPEPKTDESRSSSHGSSTSRRTRRLSLDLDAEVVEELRDAVVYLQRHGQPEVTQVGLVTDALVGQLDALREEHDLESFPPRGHLPLKPGRRPS